MKKSSLLLVIACFWLAGVFAQTGAIENLQVAQRTDGSGLVDIHFDLNGAGASYNLQFEASFDDGANYAPLSPEFLTGQLEQVLPGVGKHIIWAGKASHPETFSTQTRVRVIAIEKTTFECGEPFVDQRDGNIYATVQIGDQCWMAENLAFLPNVSPSSQGNNSYPFYYVYDYQGTDVIEAKGTDNYQSFGVLYNFPAAIISCPQGWYLPSDMEWKIFEGTVDSQYPVGDGIWDNTGYRGYDAGFNIKSTSGWLYNGNGNNVFDFNGLPAGNRFSSEGGKFHGIGDSNKWWSASTYNSGTSWLRRLDSQELRIGREYYPNSDGFAVRCLKNIEIGIVTPTVTTAEIINITSTSATSGGNVTDDGGAPVTTRGLVWSTTPNPTMEENEGFTNAGEGLGEFTSEITGLQPETMYFVRAYAENSVGVGYGEELTFTTTEWQCGDLLIDTRDGREYSTVQIGEQCWMAENLNIGTQINGSSVQLNNGTIEKYCYHNEETNCDLFGGLYQWNEVMDYSPIEGVQGICPDGWHLPTDDEWCVLEQEVDPTITCSSTWYRGVDGGGMLKDSGTTHWNSPNTGATNSSGFTALPGGNHYSNGLYGGLGDFGVWWSSSEYGSITAWARNLGNNSAQVLRSWNDKPSGLSIRCLKDDGATSNHPPSPPSNPSPETGSTNQPINLTLSWSCSDPESDPLTYDVYFGIDENPPLAISGISEQTYTPATLEYITSYNWKIVAHDDHGNSTEGEVWSFGTTNGDGQPCPGMPTVTDFDGNVYNTILIGEQCWMKENLKVTNYRNGTPIFYTGTNNSLWQNNTTGAYAFYVNDINWKVRYGVLYNWYAVNNINGLCPLGWHIPSDFEWSTLIDFIVAKGYPNELYDVNGAGNALKSCRKVNSPLSDSCNTSEHPRWSSNDTYHGFDVCGFSALPGGYRNSNGYYYSLGDIGDWWSSTEQSSTKAWGRGMYKIHGHIGRFNDNKSSGLSARCIKD